VPAILLSLPVVAAWGALGGSIPVPFSGWVSGWNAVESSLGFVVM
jgi:hypothetical protein